MMSSIRQRVKGLHFVVHPPDGKPSTYEITKKITRIGRDETNDLTIFSETISRKHAALIINPEGRHRYYIEDLHSRNGTRINGELINDRSPIKVGDVIMLSNDVTIILRDDEFERESELDQTQPIPVVNVQQTLVTETDLFAAAESVIEAPELTELTTFEVEAGTLSSEVPTKDYPPVGLLFISHSSKNVELARRISQYLTRAGIPTWLDVEQLALGDNWSNEIKQAMKQSWGALVLISPHSLNSLQCEGERQYFERAYQNKEKQIYFLLLEDIPPDELPYTVSVIQYISLARNFYSGMNRLENAITEDSRFFPAAPKLPVIQAAADIFIAHSYLPGDTKALKFVRQALKSRGMSVFDHATTSQPGSPAWNEAVSQAIEDSKYVLVIMSPDAKDSEWMKYELAQVAAKNKPTIGIYVRGSGRNLRSPRFDLHVNLNKDIKTGMNQLLTYLRKRGIGGEK
jgi:pSer/pThr/pTyr-binding forkhead associated (FHA) protein